MKTEKTILLNESDIKNILLDKFNIGDNDQVNVEFIIDYEIKSYRQGFMFNKKIVTTFKGVKIKTT